MKQVTLSLTDAELEKIQEIMRVKGLRRHAVIKLMIQGYLKGFVTGMDQDLGLHLPGCPTKEKLKKEALKVAEKAVEEFVAEDIFEEEKEDIFEEEKGKEEL